MTNANHRISPGNWMKALAFCLAANSAFLLQGCGRTPAESDSVLGSGNLPGAYDTSSTGPLIAARRTSQDAAAHQRLSSLGSNEGSKSYSRIVPVKSLGASPGGNPAVFGAKQGPGMSTALLKRSSVLAKAGANLTAHAPDASKAPAASAASDASDASDTTGFRYADSSKGYIQQVRDAPFADSLGSGEYRDSLVYKWPYSSSNPAVLFHSHRRAYAEGKVSVLVVFDEDGDGILNEAGAGNKVKLRKEWNLNSGDTAWKTVSRTTHGQTNFYDSLGEGALSFWTDSVFLASKPIWWQRTYDGDGDGFIGSSLAGSKGKVLRDGYAANGDGTFRFDYESFGPGPDGDYLKPADNERYPFRSVTINSKGQDLMETRFGDGDGDGLYWSASGEAANRAWVATTYARSDSLTSYRDSLVKWLPGPGPGDARILSYAAEAVYPDGSITRLSTRLGRGTESFSGKDTVQVWERRSFAGYLPKGADDPAGDWDSTLLVLWLVPGDLESGSDDRLVQWYSQAHFKPGRPRLTSSELLKSDQPFGAGESPVSGTYVLEDIFRATSSKSLIRSTRYREFDAARKTDAWKLTRIFENGDSSVSTGRTLAEGGSSYAQALGREASSSGWNDGATGAFRDTLTLFDAKGAVAGRETYWGTLRSGPDGDGTGEYYRKRLGEGADSSVIRYILARDASASLRMSRIEAGDTVLMAFRGDTAICREEDGNRSISSSWFPAGNGSYRLQQAIGDLRTEASLGTAEYYFGQDRSGSGVHRRQVKAGGTREGAVQFRADGAIYFDGVKVVPGM